MTFSGWILTLIVLVLPASLIQTSCESTPAERVEDRLDRDGPFEEAGEEVDDMIDEAGDHIEEAGNSVERSLD